MASFFDCAFVFLFFCTVKATTTVSNYSDATYRPLHHIAVTSQTEVNVLCSQCPSVFLCLPRQHCTHKCRLCYQHDKTQGRRFQRYRRFVGIIHGTTNIPHTRKPSSRRRNRRRSRRRNRRRKKQPKLSQQLIGRLRDRLKIRNRRRNLKRRLHKKLRRRNMRPHLINTRLLTNTSIVKETNSINITDICQVTRARCEKNELCVLKIAKARCGRTTHHDHVCATDGKTYLNRCHFTASRCATAIGSQVKIQRAGECEAGQVVQLLRKQTRRKKKNKRRRNRIRVRKMAHQSTMASHSNTSRVTVST